MIYSFKSTKVHRTVDDVVKFLPPDARRKVLDGIHMATDDPAMAVKAGGGVHSPACAACGRQGVVIYVDAQAAIKMNVDVLGGLIAHEFAHAVLGHCALAAKAYTKEAVEDIELAADIQCGKWGFRRLVNENMRKAAGF